VTFAEYANEWMETYSGRTAHGIRESTRNDYRRVLTQRAIPYFGRMQLSAVEPRDVKRYVTDVAARGLSRNTTRLALAPVRALFATAVEEGLIRSNPAVGVRLPVGPVLDDRQRAKALTEEQLAALMRAADPKTALLIRFLADTGLRIGECVALRWRDIDFGRRRVEVRRRLYKGTIGPPKSRYGRRDVPLSPGLAQALWRARPHRVSEADPLFSGRRNGKALDSSTAYRAVRAAALRARLPAVGPHALRHTCATRLFRNGLNAKQVQLWLGHHSPAFTLATYVHLLADDLPDAGFLDSLGEVARQSSDVLPRQEVSLSG
jgi:integrase